MARQAATPAVSVVTTVGRRPFGDTFIGDQLAIFLQATFLTKNSHLQPAWPQTHVFSVTERWPYVGV
jgi:hypothetical protein